MSDDLIILYQTIKTSCKFIYNPKGNYGFMFFCVLQYELKIQRSG